MFRCGLTKHLARNNPMATGSFLWKSSRPSWRNMVAGRSSESGEMQKTKRQSSRKRQEGSGAFFVHSKNAESKTNRLFAVKSSRAPTARLFPLIVCWGRERTLRRRHQAPTLPVCPSVSMVSIWCLPCCTSGVSASRGRNSGGRSLLPTAVFFVSASRPVCGTPAQCCGRESVRPIRQAAGRGRGLSRP